LEVEEENMKSGIYLIYGNEKRFIATMDELVFGSQSDLADVSHDLINSIRDVATDLIASDGDEKFRRMTITVVQ
jgi:hypothetical protein